MQIEDIYQAQADAVMEFMESNGIKREVLNIIVGPRSHRGVSIPQIAAAQHRATVLKLYQDGIKQVEIARRTGRSQSGIAMLLKRERERGNVEKRTYDARARIELS